VIAFHLSQHVDERMETAGFHPAGRGILPGIGISLARPAFSQGEPIIALAQPAGRMSAGTGWRPALPKRVVT
jgi:hypothetical protein